MDSFNNSNRNILGSVTIYIPTVIVVYLWHYQQCQVLCKDMFRHFGESRYFTGMSIFLSEVRILSLYTSSISTEFEGSWKMLGWALECAIVGYFFHCFLCLEHGFISLK